jgi:hypothetical protein
MYTKTNKEIYRFNIFLDREVEKEVDVEKTVEVEKDVEIEKKRKNKDTGKMESYTETSKKMVEEKQIVKETRKEKEKTETMFVITQPTRRQMEEADMEFSIEMSRCVKEGILTKAMLLNKYTDVGGIMSEEDAKALAKMYGALAELQTKFTNFKLKEQDPEKFTEKQKEVYEEITTLRRTIATIETNYSALLNHTADTRAQNKVISWYLLSLTQVENEKKDLVPFFAGENYDDKKEVLYRKEEDEDERLGIVYDKLMAFISFWYFSVSSTPEDFVELEKDMDEGEF